MDVHQVKSAGITVGIHAVILLLLMLLYISSPVPPWEEGLAGGGGGGSFVEFGTLDVVESKPVPVKAEVQEETAKEEIITSDVEETVTLDIPPKKKDTPKPVKKNTPVPVKTEPVKKPTVELAKVDDRKPDPRSLYPGKRSNSGSPSGTPGGTGTGGQGTGNGGGTGSGTGPGSGGGSGSGSGGGNGDGNGLYFDLGGRSMRIRPRIEERSQETGKVVIEIVVDKDGNVTTVNGPARGSTTSAPVLVNKAKQAAREAKFNKSPNGVEEQRGSITFVFQFE
jgi:TonB family protein